jgi:hypothetical protein
MGHRAWAESPRRHSAIVGEKSGGEALPVIEPAPTEPSPPSEPETPSKPQLPPLEVKKKGLLIRVVDPDLGVPVAARVQIFLRGTKARLDRPAMAFRTIDGDGRDAHVALPPGRYDVVATRGLEYSAERREVNVPGAGAAAEFHVRRVSPTPGWVGCDLHVHSHGSWDSTVTTKQRLASLVASGLDFAAPTQHNHTGNFGDAAPLGWVPSVEITTAFGHFSAVPYVEDTSPWKRLRNAGALLAEVREKNPDSLLQINHPRYQRQMGYFNLIHWKPGATPPALPPAVDALEVYNGFELPQRRKTEAVMHDWLALFESGRQVWATAGSDVHGVAGRMPGYPRLYAAVPGDDDSIGKSIDGAQLVRQIRAGHSFLTSGPMLEVSQGELGPGDEVKVEEGVAKIRVKVSAPPWVDVRELEAWVGGKVALRRPLSERRISVDVPEGTLDEARAAALRFDGELLVPVASGARALVIVVKGDAAVVEAMPTMPYQPMAFSNPMRLPAQLGCSEE